MIWCPIFLSCDLHLLLFADCSTKTHCHMWHHGSLVGTLTCCKMNKMYVWSYLLNLPRNCNACITAASEYNRNNKKLSYCRETARQLPTWRGLSLQSTPPPASGYTYAYGRFRNSQQTYVKRAIRKAHFKLNRAFKVIQGYPYLCRQEPRAVYCRNVQLMPPLFLKLTKIWQREHSKFVDFNDPTQVWRRPSKKRLGISTNDLYCQKLESLAYIFAADSVGLHSLVFT